MISNIFGEEEKTVKPQLLIKEFSSGVPDAEEILQAFGLPFKQIKLMGLKGRQYQVQDAMFELIELIQGADRVKELASQIFTIDESFATAVHQAVREGNTSIAKTNMFSSLTADKYIREVLQ